MSFSQPGAFDLSSLAKPRPAAGGDAPAPDGAVYVIDVTDGETPLAGTTVTVTAASTPIATPTPTSTSTPAPSPAEGNSLLWIVIAIVAVVLIAGIILWVVLARRRSAGSPSA